MLNIAIIYGSVRENRIGIRAVKFISKKIKARNHRVKVVDPLEYKLPLLKKTFKEYEQAPKEMKEISEILKWADAFIIVSGEYNHSIPPALSNLLDHFMQEYFWKPSGILCYSVGSFGGVRAAMQLRAMLPELGTISIPSIFPISKINESLDDEGNDTTSFYDERVNKFLSELEWFAYALKYARKNRKTPY